MSPSLFPPYSLFCLDGVHRGHVVAGDVARGTRAQRPGLPPVPLPGQGSRECGGGGTDRQTRPPSTVCLLTLHTAPPDPALPHPSLLKPPMTHGPGTEQWSQAELGFPAWVLCGVPKHKDTSPGWYVGAGGGRTSGEAHVLLMMWNFSPFWNVRSSSVLAS